MNLQYPTKLLIWTLTLTFNTTSSAMQCSRTWARGATSMRLLRSMLTQLPRSPFWWPCLRRSVCVLLPCAWCEDSRGLQKSSWRTSCRHQPATRLQKTQRGRSINNDNCNVFMYYLLTSYDNRINTCITASGSGMVHSKKLGVGTENSSIPSQRKVWQNVGRLANQNQFTSFSIVE